MNKTKKEEKKHTESLQKKMKRIYKKDKCIIYNKKEICK